MGGGRSVREIVAVVSAAWAGKKWATTVLGEGKAERATRCSAARLTQAGGLALGGQQLGGTRGIWTYGATWPRWPISRSRPWTTRDSGWRRPPPAA
jgi:hypothetical protein